MEIVNDLLPYNVLVAAECTGNGAVRNARYRTAVCAHFGLRFHRIGGDGNCFFCSVCVALKAVLGANNVPESLATPDMLRASLILFLRQCASTRHELSERILADLNAELDFELQCSTRAKIGDRLIHGFKPSTTENPLESYFDAIAADGVWVAGYHWLRAASVVAGVRVAVVIFGHDSVIYFGEGASTIYLYKVFIFCCAESDVRCMMCDVRCAMCDVRCAMCDVRCAMCDVRCAMCDV